MGRLILIALRNLRASKKRTLLLGGAIASVTMLLVLLSSVSNGIQDTMLRAATTLSTGHVNVAGYFKITSGQAAPVVTKYAPLEELVKREIPEVASVVDRIRGWGKIVSPKKSRQVGIGGIDVDSEKDFEKVLQIVKGDLYGLREPNTVLIFESQAEALDVGVGDMVTLSAPTVRGVNNSIDVRVVAVAKNIGFMSNWNVYTPKQAVRDIYLMDESATGAIQLYLKDYRDAETVAARLRELIKEKTDLGVLDPQSDPFWMKFQVVTREDWTGQKIDITTWKDEMSFFSTTLEYLDKLGAGLITILMIIIVIGVMNGLFMAIRERTREIGTLRAIGMSRGGIMSMFVIEAAVLSFLATVVGIAVGVTISWILNAWNIHVSTGFQLFLMRDTLRLVVAPASLVKAAAIIVGVTTLFALYPAYRAARMRPITAIHHVG